MLDRTSPAHPVSAPDSHLFHRDPTPLFAAPPPGPWEAACVRAAQPDPVDQIVGLGRWWYQYPRGRMLLSAVAAGILGVRPGASVDTWLAGVVAEDVSRLRQALASAAGDALVVCEFRVAEPDQGLRWLRLQLLPSEGGGLCAGVLTDVTAARHSARRERFNFALTQYLIGTDTLDEAINKIIHLVCDDLGWEWGAFWALEQRGGELLRCRHAWHAPARDFARFRCETEQLVVRPGEGLVGQVWRNGKAQWVDADSVEALAPRAVSARQAGLQSGYFFPVTYVAPDGRLHSPGVLEFFSDAPRQREAQLPGLAESISALIAQTAQRMVQQERVRVLAQTDEMTGLVNRAHFHHLLDEACARCAPDVPFGVLYIDLDQFKPINDAYGHAAGNVTLCQFADRLLALAPPGAVVARLGGDEFALLTAPGIHAQALDALAGRILEAARTRFSYQGHELQVSASIGLSLFPQHGDSTAQLLHAADAAMYLSKRNGRNLASHYRDDGNDQQAALARQLTLLSELHDALARHEFFLEYQPICDAQGARVAAVEALIRWRKADGGVVPPDVFIPIAERSRLIVHIGRWVVEQVCRDLPRMRAGGMGELQVHINMAAPEFLDGGLPGELMAILNAAGVAPRQICLELTEGVVMKRIEKSLPVMRELRRLGFEVGLDDFGMGYSSLSMLKTLPIGALKIDRSFIDGLPYDRDDGAIVRTILELGRNMKMRVIAEGVENDAQLGFLRQFGCTLIQGYLLGRPMVLERLIAACGNATRMG